MANRRRKKKSRSVATNGINPTPVVDESVEPTQTTARRLKGTRSRIQMTEEELSKGVRDRNPELGMVARSFPIMNMPSKDEKDVVNGMPRMASHTARRSRDENLPELAFARDGEGGALGNFHNMESKKAAISAFADLAPGMFGERENDSYDSLDFLALNIMHMLREGIIEFAQLKNFEQNVFYRYVYRTNPVIGRIIDLHTDLPLSKIKLQSPKDVPEIIRDYVLNFYNKIFDGINFEEILRKIVQSYHVYGGSDVMVDDTYIDDERVLQSMDDMDPEAVLKMGNQDMSEFEEVEKKYSLDPLSVGVEDRWSYLKRRFPLGLSISYKGPSRVRVINFWEIVERYNISELDYESISVDLSESLKTALVEGESEGNLLEMGYSRGYLELVEESRGETGDYSNFVVENNIYSGLPWLIRFERPDKSSIIQRVWREALEWDTAKIAINAKLGRLGQAGRVISAPEADGNQLATLESEVMRMLEDPAYAIVTNFEVNWEEVDLFVKEELSELGERIPDISEELSMGLGVPGSLLTGDSQYSGDVVRLDVLNQFYVSFATFVLQVLEDKLLKPIAMRKGFIMVDEWGEWKLIYPKLTFSRVGIRSEETYELLYELYEKNSLPVSIILDLLNIDVDDADRAIKEDMFTTRDPQFMEVIGEIYNQAGDDIYAMTDVLDRIMENLPIRRKKKDDGSEDEDDEGFGGGGIRRF